MLNCSPCARLRAGRSATSFTEVRAAISLDNGTLEGRHRKKLVHGSGFVRFEVRKAPGRVDLCLCDAAGVEQRRLQDVPIHPAQKEVIFNESIELARVAPAHVLVVKLVAVEEPGERVLGQYTFHHTPS